MKNSTAFVFSSILWVFVLILAVIILMSETVTPGLEFLLSGACLAFSFFSWHISGLYYKFLSVLFFLNGLIWLFVAFLSLQQ